MKLVLFDIDGTLISTNKSGFHSYLEAFRLTYFGAADAPTNIDVDFAGNTDQGIFRNLVTANNLGEVRRADWQRFVKEYTRLLGERSKTPDGWRLYDGVREALETLAPLSLLGLLTGNLENGAEIKLKTLGIHDFFPVGGFAEDGFIRDEIAQAALRKATTHYDHVFQPHDVWVIGDTPHDISCARHIGANVLAVATGRYTEEELAAHKPDLLLKDLTHFRKETIL